MTPTENMQPILHILSVNLRKSDILSINFTNAYLGRTLNFANVVLKAGSFCAIAKFCRYVLNYKQYCLTAGYFKSFKTS